MPDIIENQFIPQFLDYFRNAEKQPGDEKIGLELEITGFHKPTRKRLTVNDLMTVLNHFNRLNDWEPVYENGVILEMQRGMSKISLEPGLQLEFSTSPYADLDDIKNELVAFQQILADISSRNNWFWLCVGYDPFTAYADIPHNPKKRYDIMRRYLPPLGPSVLRMMHGTTGAQVNFDYTDEADMCRKMTVGNALSVIVAALFSNSAFEENRATSAGIRSAIWNDVDKSRSGYVETVMQADFSYLSYIRYALDVPMLILKKNGITEDHAGNSFTDYLRQNPEGFDMKDWVTQLSVTFPFIRLRNTIEVRTADSGNIAHLMALCAFWKGLFYHPETLNRAFEEVVSYPQQTLENICSQMPLSGLKTRSGDFFLLEKAERLTDLARQGLSAIAPNEAAYLEPLNAILASGKSTAEKLMDEFFENPSVDFMELAKTYDLLFAA